MLALKLKIPKELLKYKGWTGNQIENRYSHWIWRQYASCVWDDIRGNMGDRKEKGVLPYREAREEDDEKHLHPLQLDVITRAVELWSELRRDGRNCHLWGAVVRFARL